MKFYRGAARAARTYVEQDRSRADEYYLAEGSGVATRYAATPDGGVERAGRLTGETYERWVAGVDVATGQQKGRLRDDASALRFVEVVVNGPKTWSLAAALYPEISRALDHAQERAATQIIGWVAQHATTRVGPRGRQVQVPVERVEAAVIQHYTSRTGDPHRHLHLQVNARVWAAAAWRGLHSVGIRDSVEAINGIGHAAVTTDPQFRTALAARGFTLDPATGEIDQLAPYVGAFSARSAQIGRNLDRYEADWRRGHRGEEPGPRLREVWDRRAWAQARPDKVVPKDGAELVARWNQELRALGYRDPVQPIQPQRPGGPLAAQISQVPHVPRVGGLDRAVAVEVVVSRLAARRSAWNTADVRGQVEHWIASTGVVVDAGVRVELAEDLTARTVAACTPLLRRTDVPEHVRALTSLRVLAVEADIVARLGNRRDHPARRARLSGPLCAALDGAQCDAVSALAGEARLLVVEGAAGAGKTTILAATTAALARQGHRLIVVTPTLKAAEVAAQETAADGYTAAWLIHQHGWRWDDDGHWTHQPTVPSQAATLASG